MENCKKCGSGANAHSVTDEFGLLVRRCHICGTAQYKMVAEKRPKRPRQNKTVVKSLIGNTPRLRTCKNCGCEFQAYKRVFCEACKEVRDRKSRREARGRYEDRRKSERKKP